MSRNIPFGEDGDFSEKVLAERHNNELANKLAHKIKDSFNVKSKTKFAPEPSDVAEITIEF